MGQPGYKLPKPDGVSAVGRCGHPSERALRGRAGSAFGHRRAAAACGRYEPPIPGSPTASRSLAFRGGVGAAARTVGLPYGYTLTVWSTAQTTIAEHGTPRVWEIALYALGAVTAYWVARAWATGTVPERDGTHATAYPALRGGVVQAVAIGTPVAAAAVLAQALPSAVCWPLAGLVTVLGYLGVMGLSHALAARAGDD